MSDKIMVVDDDQNILFAFQELYEASDHELITAKSGVEALRRLEREKPAVLFLDVKMPGMDGLEVLKSLREKHLEIPVILITGFGDMDTAIRAMQLGAYDYLTKPLDIEKVRIVGERALEMIRMRRELVRLQRALEEKEKAAPAHRTRILGQHPRLMEIFKRIGVISTTPNTTNVLILGESGTGKELVARVIHESGPHASEPFVAINCTVLPESLLESELFGHEKGAFTGADSRKLGKFEVAGKGTLLLDEIGDMPESLQKKLLRVIQERTFERLGGHESIPLQARIIAATNKNLAEEVRKGRFREDLYFRLNVFEIELPPLRERREDIELLAYHFLHKFNRRFGKHISTISAEVLRALQQYDFPGNVRELENLIERAVVLERGDILSPDSFPPYIFNPGTRPFLDIPIPYREFNRAKQAVVEAFERKFLAERLQQTGGNVSEAARLSGLERQSFQRLMKKYGLSSEDFRAKK